MESAWAEGITGEGINISVVDDGMYYRHEDLEENVNAALNHDYTTFGSISHPWEHHGTKVAGIIAAQDNDIGVRGVAPRATIYGYNLLRDSTDENKLDAMTRNRETTAVSNNSWGTRLSQGPGLATASQLWAAALHAGITTGYHGRGTFYVFGAGNRHDEGYNSNLDEQINHHAVTVVCGVNEKDVRGSYSNTGSNLWVCGPTSGGSDNRRMITTENYDRYVYDFGGTSAATPIVSGVAALMRQANPNLTWRDLKLILAASARKNNPTDSGWLTGARKYRAETDADRYHFNHEYGFGVVDAEATVSLARNWQNLPPMLTSTVGSGLLNARVPDAPLSGPPTTVSYPLNLDSDFEFTEFVEVNVEFDHVSFRDLHVELVSPGGAVSSLAVPFDTFTPDDPDDIDFFPLVGVFRLGSARHLGEDPSGTWTLRVTDHFYGGGGTLNSWSLTVYGHSQPPPAPQVDVSFAQSAYSVPEGGSVAVTVSLNADPQRTVAVPIIVTNQGGATSEDYSGIPETLTFDGGGTTQKTFSFLATDDQTADADESVKLGFGVLPERVSAGITAETTVSITDNDIAGITVDPTSLTILEGATGTYTVKLNTQPQEAVTVTVVDPRDNTDVTASPMSLTFNSATWSTPQSVTVTAAQDDDAQDDSATVTHTVSGYGALLTADSVTVTVTDDEPELEVNFDQSAYSVVEGESVEVTVSLNTDPQRTVVVPVIITNHGATEDDYSGVPESVTFFGGGATQQTFSFAATDDNVVDTNESVMLGFGVLPSRVSAGTTAETTVSIADNDDAAGMPTVQMSLAETPRVRLRQPVPVITMFNQPVVGFGIDDVVVTSGYAENLTSEAGGTNYSFEVVPTIIDVVSVDITAGAAQNSHGQNSMTAPQMRVGLPYDDNHDSIIGLDEAIDAVSDYFSGIITLVEAIGVISLYFSGI